MSAPCSADVNVAFQRAAHKVLLDDDNLLPLLHLTVDYQGKDKGEAAAPHRTSLCVGCAAAATWGPVFAPKKKKKKRLPARVSEV